MIAYTTLGVNDMARATAFYDAVFAPLCAARHHQRDLDRLCPHRRPGTVLPTRPFDGQPATCGNGVMLAFLAEDRAAIDAFHVAALAAGGADEGPPGVREGMNPVFYAAYVRDPDGNKLCAFVRR